MKRLPLLLLLALTGCGAFPRLTSTPLATAPVVCIAMPSVEAGDAAVRGISWWGEPVSFSCDHPTLVVHPGSPPPNSPFAASWTDGHEIVYVSGSVFAHVRHEFGHILGYPDGQGVMASGPGGRIGDVYALPKGGAW